MTQNEGRLLAHLRWQLDTLGEVHLNMGELKTIVFMLDRLAKVELFETDDDKEPDEEETLDGTEP